jgi:hypothetical protein
MTGTNLDRYRNDLKDLILRGEMLELAMEAECYPDEIEAHFKKQYGDKAKAAIKNLPKFKTDYQIWYSEAKLLVKQLLPDRLADLVSSTLSDSGTS